MRTNKWTMWATGVSVVLAAVVAGVALIGPTLSEATEGPTGDSVDESLSYDILDQGDGHSLIVPRYDHSSAEMVHSAAAAMNQRAESLASSRARFKGEIVFKRPIAIEDYNQFIRDLGVQLESSVVRALDLDGGPRITITVDPGYAGNPWAQDSLDAPAIDPAKETDWSHPGVNMRVLGVITAVGVEFDPETYERVRADSRVFAVATLDDEILNDLRSKYPEINVEKAFVAPSGLYWHMEETGIAPRGD